MNSGSREATLSEKSSKPGGVAADVDLQRRAGGRRRDHVARAAARAGRWSPRPAARSSGSRRSSPSRRPRSGSRGATVAMPGRVARPPPAAPASCGRRCRPRPSGCRPRAGTGRWSRRRTPRSAGRRRRAGSRDSGWLPSSGWPRRSWVTGKAKISSTSTPAAIESHGRAVTRSPQRAKARDGSTCSGFFGFSQRANAPDHDRQDRERRDDDGADARSPRRCRACR